MNTKILLASMAAVGIATTEEAASVRTYTVQNVAGYNSWSFVETVGDLLVCAYSRGKEHSIDERCRGVYARSSSDGGKTWSSEVEVVNTPNYGESAIGKGKDADGAMLLWVRCRGKNPCHALYRSRDGKVFTRIALLTPDPMPMQITDVFHVPGVGLMCLWFAGRYRDLPENSWGTLTSADNGITWVQHTIESGLMRNDWPTEPSCVYLGDGRILAIARSEPPQRRQFQLQSTDNGKTWRKLETNITDVSQSTPSLVLSEDGNSLRNYYYHRGKGELKCRIVNPETIWDNPLKWPEPSLIAKGSPNSHHAGNVNAIRLKDADCCTIYSGDEQQTDILCHIIPDK